MQARKTDWHKLKSMDDQRLIADLKRSIGEENKSLSHSLVYISEVGRRRLYLTEGYASLYKFCISVLPLSPGSVYRRSQVARHVRRHPLLLRLISEGRLTLTVASKIAPMLKNVNQDQLIMSFVGMTSREVDHFLASKFGCEESPDHISPAKDKVIPLVGSTLLLGSSLNAKDHGSDLPKSSKNPSKNQMMQTETQSQERQLGGNQIGQDAAHVKREKRYNFRFSGGEKLKMKIQRAKEVMSHKYPEGKLEDLIGAALDELLSKHAPELQKSRSPTKQINTHSSYIPKQLRRDVFADAGYCCEAVSQSGVRCRSKHYLEVDHLFPRALGGRTERSNLQILCKAHNLQKARDQLGAHFVNRKIVENRGGP